MNAHVNESKHHSPVGRLNQLPSAERTSFQQQRFNSIFDQAKTQGHRPEHRHKHHAHRNFFNHPGPPPPEKHTGANMLKGAITGATAGAAFGPWGAAIGGVVGGICGLFS